MKTTRSFQIAALAALLVGAASVSAAQPPAAGSRPRAERQREAGQPPRARGDWGARGRGGQMDRALLRGITLTDAQRTQAREINARFAEERQALGRSLRERAGTAGQRPDSAARAGFRAAMLAQTRAITERQTAAIRGILTAEQQATFDRNLATARERLQARAERVRGDSARAPRARGGKRGGKRGG